MSTLMLHNLERYLTLYMCTLSKSQEYIPGEKEPESWQE